jgi:hypothetical protein
MTFSAEICAELDSCDYLFLREATELDYHGLHLVVEEGIPSLEAVSIKVGGTEITGGHRVEATAESRLFDVVWQSYVAYSVRNESFVGRDEYEISVGRRLRIYSKSRFLDFIGSATFATDEYPGPLQHIGVYCENHIVDVVSTKEPQVRLIRPTGPRASNLRPN